MSLATEIDLLKSTPAHTGVQLPIYMDNHATTPLDPRVLEAYLGMTPEMAATAMQGAA